MKNLKTFFQNIKTKGDINSSLLLMLLLSADFIFISLHIIHQRNHLQILRSGYFYLGQDLGYAEVYQYIKYFWIILLFTYVLICTKCLSYISWIVVFIYFLCDDALQVHEILGRFIAKSFHFSPPFNLRLEDFGELVVSATVGLVLLPILVLAFIYGSRTFKKISTDMILFVLALVFFGVFMDMADVAIHLGWVVEQSLGIIEDGGEMVVVSLILWYVFIVASHKGNSDFFLFDLIHLKGSKVK
jgi:hypothetical protein